MTGIEERLRRLEDLEEIRDVTARYANCVNKGYAGKQIDYEGLRSVYTEDAVWHSDDMKTHVEGLQPILDGLREATATVERSVHSFTNPVIDLDGDRATSNWIMPIGSVHDGLNRAVFMIADFGYRRTPTGWRIATASIAFGLMLAQPQLQPQ